MFTVCRSGGGADADVNGANLQTETKHNNKEATEAYKRIIQPDNELTFLIK